MAASTPLGSSLKACSQIRRTVQPPDSSALRTRRSLIRFAWIFRAQKRRLLSGIVRQRLQPCQKHPSTKTTSRPRGKMKSGRPGSADLVPIRQPRTPLLASIPRSLSSVVRFPRLLLRLITVKRAAGIRLSIYFYSDPLGQISSKFHGMPPNKLWRQSVPDEQSNRISTPVANRESIAGSE